MKLPVGISDFKQLRLGGYYFVDKSLLIRDFIENPSHVILIPRPRRFGKTINMLMLEAFLELDPEEKNRELFDGLEISKDQEFCSQHQGRYPVIYISFKDIKYQTFAEVKRDTGKLLAKLYEKHDYLLDGDHLSSFEQKRYREVLSQNPESFSFALSELTKYLHRAHKIRPIVIVDEYDTPIHAGYMENYYSDIASLMRGMLGAVFKDNSDLGKGLMTGIMQIAQESIFSGLNNFESHNLFSEEYDEYFGFTEEEVVKLVQDYDNGVDLAKLKEWYNGYQFGSATLYNPWSILNCLKRKVFKPYWINTSDNLLIRSLITDSKMRLKTDIELLIQGKISEQSVNENLVLKDLGRDSESVWTLLLYGGYLKPTSFKYTERCLLANLAIPNKEVNSFYQSVVQSWFSSVTGSAEYERFVKSFSENDWPTFENYLRRYILESGSYFDFNQRGAEQVFHSFVLGLVIGLKDRYLIMSNREAGFGRCDMCMIPKDPTQPGILMEFKQAESVETLETAANMAIEQITRGKYLEIFAQHEINQRIALGVGFLGKKLMLVVDDGRDRALAAV